MRLSTALTKYILVLSGLPLFAASSTELKALYNTLDPQSVEQSLAFYGLYPESEEGLLALKRATALLRCDSTNDVAMLTPLLTRIKGTIEILKPEEIAIVEKLAALLPNRKLKGYYAESEKEVLALPSDEIDLGMALLLSQLDGKEDRLLRAKSYSALLDLMALQIVARLPKNATAEQKIEETNRLIFDQMHFRFPPQSIFAEQIDKFTFLPSVMDNHLGVCLGVTALYIAIAQRIDLPLEIVTPPGHIYVRYRDGDKIINIETTARGIDPPSETYLGVNTRSLKLRDIKQVIGMTYVNEASIYLNTEHFDQARSAYEKARPYLEGDPWVEELLAYSYLFTGDRSKGRKILATVKDYLPEESVVTQKLAADYLNDKVDLEGIRAVFMQVDETRASILTKQKRLEKVVANYPEFRDGLLQLAITWIQLSRAREAIDYLERYHAIDPGDPSVEYYLSVLHGERYDFKSSWKYLQNAQKITAARDYSPRALKDLRRVLILHSPP